MSRKPQTEVDKDYNGTVLGTVKIAAPELPKRSILSQASNDAGAMASALVPGAFALSSAGIACSPSCNHPPLM